MGIIPFIYTRFIYAELIHVENFLSDRSPRSSLPTGEQLYSRNSPSVVIVASPFFEKLIQSPPLPGLQNFQSMSMGKRNRSLDERGEGGGGWLAALVFRSHSISRFVSRKFSCILLTGSVYIFPNNMERTR